MKVTRVDTVRCGVGEGAIWDTADKALWFTSIMEATLHRYDPVSGETRTWQAPGHIGAVALHKDGRAVIGSKDRVLALDLASGAVEELSGPLWDDPAVTINDGAVDAAGRFLLGGCSAGFENPRPIGGLFRVNPDGSTGQLDSGIHQSNSHCFAPDGRTLYASDSFIETVFAYDYDPASGAIGERRVFAQTTDLGGVPDGAVCDSEGRVWISLFKAGMIAAFRPDGTLERTVELPTKLGVSCAFGGEKLDRLFVTTIDPAVFGWPEDPAGGYVYVVDGLGVTGVTQARFG